MMSRITIPQRVRVAWRSQTHSLLTILGTDVTGCLPGDISHSIDYIKLSILSMVTVSMGLATKDYTHMYIAACFDQGE